MARQRMIKPEFWSDESVNECSVSARLLFIATWNHADDEGNLLRSSKQLKAQVFPYDNIDCEPLILELLSQGLLIEYSVSVKKYLNIPNFKKHQLINRPSKPQCPLYEYSLRTHSEVSKEVKEVGQLPSESIHKTLEPKKQKPIDVLLAMGVDKKHAEDWLIVRKEKRAAFTNSSLDITNREAIKAGITFAQAIHICASKSWQNFDASWKWQGVIENEIKSSINPNIKTPEQLEQESIARAAHKRARMLEINATVSNPVNPWDIS